MDITWETIGRPKPLARPGPIGAILDESLSHSRPLARFIASAVEADEPILLVVNDPHRSTLTAPAIAALARVTTGTEIPPGSDARSAKQTGPIARVPRFRAIVATGTHRFSAGQRREFEQATFPDCGLNIKDVVWHDASDPAALTQVAGVRMHAWIGESRFMLPIGSVEPHYFAGVTGPHKTATIGCMSREDIETSHAGAMSPASDILHLYGNPVFDGIAAILRRMQSEGKTVCAIGEVVQGDTLLASAVGDPLDVIDTLLPTVRRTYLRRVDGPVDLLRLRVPPPLGCNFYQADKALKNNHLAVRDGGGILLEAECVESIGPNAFLGLLRQAGDYATAQRIVNEEGYRLGDHKAVKLRHLMDPACRGVHVALVSPHVSRTDLAGTGIEIFSEIHAALRWLGSNVTGPLRRGLIIEDAGMVCATPVRA